MSIRITSLVLTNLMIGLSPLARAQQAAPVAPETTPLQRVEVTTQSSRGDGRVDAAVGRFVLTEKEILRFQDTNLPDVLRRVPGVNVVTSPGGAQEIRLRGLGEGYTQILLNGDPVPPGFSIDSLSPALIERIEVQKAGSVDSSARAIAGTVNIILKRKNNRRADLTTSAWQQSGRGSGSLALDWASKSDSFDYGVTGEIRHANSALFKGTAEEAWDAQGRPTAKMFVSSPQTTEADSLSLVPRLGWQTGANDKWKVDGLLSYTKRNIHIIEDRDLAFGIPPVYASNDLHVPQKQYSARTTLGWDHAFQSGAKLNAKFGVQYNRRDADPSFVAYDDKGTLILDRNVHSVATDTTQTFSGKYQLPQGGGHTIVLGWDGARTKRSENRLQRDFTPTGLPPNNLDDAYFARVQRVAVFAQDEVELGKSLSAYVGLRWEGLRTHSEGSNFTQVDTSSGIYSPVLNFLWKLSGKPADQIRLGFSRTYKAPETADLTPRIYLSTNNSPLEPDGKGNPGLRPELATGIDAAYEHYLPNDGILSLSVFARRIDNVIINRLEYVPEGWLRTPTNMGEATVRGIELEMRTSLKNWSADAPAIVLRGNLARNWSRVNAVPGPDNRLARQIPFSLNAGAEYSASGMPLKMGGNFNFQAGGPVRLLDTLDSNSRPQRTLDWYGVWSFANGSSLRCSVTNALHRDVGLTTRYVDQNGRARNEENATTSAVYRLTYQMHL